MSKQNVPQTHFEADNVNIIGECW